MKEWLFVDVEQIVLISLSCVCILIGVITITRIAGLRTFAKISSIDFASTIAIGSIIAAVIMNENQSVLKGFIAIGFIVLLQIGSSHFQRKSNWYDALISNKPIELIRDGIISEKNLKRTRVSKEDLMAKLREANAISLDNVLSVVLETTGDISVLHSNSKKGISDKVMIGVERIEHI